MARPRKNATITEELPLGAVNTTTTTIESDGAEPITAVIPDEGNTYKTTNIEEPIAPVENPAPAPRRKGGVGGARGKQMAPPTKTPIREMELTDEQQMMIIRDNIKKMVTSKNGDELQFGTIPALVRSPQDDVGFIEVSILLNVDVRLVNSAWDYYKENAPAPKVKDFLNIVQEFTGRGKQFPRVAQITLN